MFAITKGTDDTKTKPLELACDAYLEPTKTDSSKTCFKMPILPQGDSVSETDVDRLSGACDDVLEADLDSAHSSLYDDAYSMGSTPHLNTSHNAEHLTVNAVLDNAGTFILIFCDPITPVT